jgi:hypothetical protein
MASEVINALFQAKETISDALKSAQSSTQNFDSQLDELNVTMAQAGVSTQGAEEEFDSFANSIRDLRLAGNSLDQQVDKLDESFLKLAGSGEVSEQEIEQFTNAVRSANLTAEMTDSAIDDLRNGLVELTGAGVLSGEQLGRLQNRLTTVSMSAAGASNAVDTINSAMLALYGTSQAAESGVSQVNRELSETTREATAAATSLGILSSVAEASSFRFSSLSVNVGPFNLALKNLLVQLPAVITGMGTVLAVVTALTTAFLTLASATGALLVGGAVAWFEEFSGQFEDSAQAAEALMGALRDLFTAAIEPLMTEANMDLFISAIDGAARVVNRFAQFFQQMRGDILSFMSGIGGDMESFFEALHDSFAIVAPVLQDFINFFIEGFPRILMRFSNLTKEIDSNIGGLIDSFSNLFVELLEFGQLIIGSVAPVVSIVVSALADIFAVINSVHDAVGTTVIQFIALSAVFVRIQSMVGGVAGAMATLTGVMKAQAVMGSSLAKIYLAMRGVLIQLARGNLSLAAAKKILNSVMKTEIAATKASILSKWSNLTAIMANIAGYLGLSGAISTATAAAGTFWSVVSLGLIPAIVAVVAAISAVVAAIMNFDAVSSAASSSVDALSGAFTFLKQLIATAVIPIINLLAAIGKTLASPFIAIGEGISMVIGKLLSFVPVGNSSGGVLSFLADAAFELTEMTNLVVSVMTVLIQAIGSLIRSGLMAWFNFVIDAIDFAATVLGNLIDKFQQTGPAQKFGSVVSTIFDAVSNSLMSASEMVDALVKELNKIPGVDIEGPAMDAAKVRSEIADESEQQEKDDISTEPNVNLSFEESLENNVDVDADPEDKSGLSRVVKDAMEEANSLERRRNGYTGN